LPFFILYLNPSATKSNPKLFLGGEKSQSE